MGERTSGLLVKDTSMHVAEGYNSRQGEKSVLVRDKRGQHHQPSQREGDWLPITELGSKAVYHVYAERFIPVTPSK
jgi:hypothetical protein